MSLKALAAQGGRFALLGAAATVVHLSLALAALRSGAEPWLANLVGFATAVGISYAGNAVWTFRAALWSAGQASRFAVVSLAGLALNQGLTAVFSVGLRWPSAVSVVAASLAVPTASFLAARLWVFRGARTG